MSINNTSTFLLVRHTRLRAFVFFAMLFVSGIATTSAQIWVFTTTDGIDTATGTVQTDTTWAEAQGSEIIQVTVTQLLSLNINGTEIIANFGNTEVRDDFNQFIWDQSTQSTSPSTQNALIFDVVSGAGSGSVGFQIGHGLETFGRHRTFTYGSFDWGSSDIDFVATSTNYSPSAVPELSNYAAILGLIALSGTCCRRRRRDASK